MRLDELAAPDTPPSSPRNARERWSARTPGCERWPRKRAAGPSPTSPGCCRPPARPGSTSCTAWYSGGPTASAPTTTPRSSGSAATTSRSPPVRRAPSYARTRAGTNRSGAATLARHRPDGRHRPRRDPAQPRVSTIVAVGVSVNVAITNLVMDAVNAAYRVVLPGTQLPGSRRLRGRRHRQHPVPVGHRHHHRRTAGGLAVAALLSWAHLL